MLRVKCRNVLKYSSQIYAQMSVTTRRSNSYDARGILAIRREDFSAWERRAPLSPSHVRKLVHDGFKVIVQPSNRRAYPMTAYQQAGAVINEDISEASVIFGVKQIPIDTLEKQKTYVFFSHTIKAQEANMPLLDAILERKIRLIDYEKMVNERGKRIVAFGKYAGVTGMINILHGLGLRLLSLGHHTPFMHIGPAHNYRNAGMARQAIRDAGYEIALDMMPKSIGPLVFVFTGSGNVSQGAQEVFRELPHEYVDVEHLPEIARKGVTSKIYVCEVNREDHLVRRDGGEFNSEEFDQYPERYASAFNRKIAPFMSVLINGIYWGPNDPRLLTIPDAKKLLSPQQMPWLPASRGCPALPHRLLAICDISADPGGSIEFMKTCTTIDKPFCLYDAEEHMNFESFNGNGVLMCSIENMPAQLPREATDFFGSLLLPYVPDIMRSDAKAPFENYPGDRSVKDAIIASNGELTPNFKYIDDLRNENRSKAANIRASMSSEKRVLILGAGYVSNPVVDYLTRSENTSVTVASQFKDEIEKIASNFPRTMPVHLEVANHASELEELIKEHDCVVSLLPFSLHPMVAKLCIKHRTNMCTASYRSAEMMKLEQEAIDAGVTIMNEVGVDPGIDHLLAIECFDQVRENGGKITSFVSYCGGLPAPEFSGNPLRYKFSWSPYGVLKNSWNSAKFLENGKQVEIPGDGSLLNSMRDMDFLPGFNFEGFPNRDSTPYAKLYDIESAHTILRGTLRYKGFSNVMKSLMGLGFLDDSKMAVLHPQGPNITWRELLAVMINQNPDCLIDSLRAALKVKFEGDEQLVSDIERLGLLNDTPVEKNDTPIATLSSYLSKRLSFGPGERDLLVMHHEVGIQWPDGVDETRHIDFVVYGDPEKYSAMAATVGFPTAIATKMILEGEIQEKGILLPFSGNIYRPMLKRLKQEGLEATEFTVKK